MNKIYKSLILLGLSLGLTACASTPAINTTNITNVDWSNVRNLKEGSSCAYYLLGALGPFGAPRLPDAIRSANIRKVYAVDETYGYYVLYGRTCLNVWGE